VRTRDSYKQESSQFRRLNAAFNWQRGAPSFIREITSDKFNFPAYRERPNEPSLLESTKG
jgi:hypothetical protein